MRIRMLPVALTATLLLGLPLSLSAQDACGEREAAPGPLVTPDWLKRHRADSGLVILHADRSRAAYDSAHIAGARFIASSQFIAPMGPLLTELPSVTSLDSLFESLGVGDRGRIVLYGETLPVTRLFFTLDYLGAGDRVSVLNGGIAAWRRAGGATTSDPTARPARSTFTPRPQPDVLADADYVNAHRTDGTTLLLDARTQDEYDGTVLEEAVARPGHIPGAMKLEWTELMADGAFREKGALRQLFSDAGAGPGKEIITYCRVGSRASALYFAARILGYKVRLYDGSMNEWAGRTDLPMERKP